MYLDVILFDSNRDLGFIYLTRSQYAVGPLRESLTKGNVILDIRRLLVRISVVPCGILGGFI